MKNNIYASALRIGALILFFMGITNKAFGMGHALEPQSPFNPFFTQLSTDYYTNLVSKPIMTKLCHPELSKKTLIDNKQDMTNGPLKKYRIVTFYGHPKSTQMGILGQLTPNELIRQLKLKTDAYTKADPCHPAIPAIELIATVAGRNPGPDGLYYHRTSLSDIDRYAKLAKDNGALLILDVQLGRDNALHQVQLFKKYLELPYVHLAIDTEFHVGNGQIPGVQLGQIDGSSIEKAIQYVSDLTEKHHLPDKVVIVHQFKGEIIQNKEAIQPTSHVEVALNFDGFGPITSKEKGYRLFVKNEPIQYGGFKLFFRQDISLLSPNEVLRLNPSPAVINYQ